MMQIETHVDRFVRNCWYVAVGRMRFQPTMSLSERCSASRSFFIAPRMAGSLRLRIAVVTVVRRCTQVDGRVTACAALIMVCSSMRRANVPKSRDRK